MCVNFNSPNVVIGHMSGGTININNGTAAKQEPEKKAEPVCEDITPIQEEKDDPTNSIIFTKKAKKEAKEAAILAALQNSVHGRRDKTRAFVDELHFQQKEGYIDAHYNAQVMYDELKKIIPLSFGYDAFKRQYNYTRV